MQHVTAKKEWKKHPKLNADDWMQLPVPIKETDLLPNGDRVLPLARVTP